VAVTDLVRQAWIENAQKSFGYDDDSDGAYTGIMDARAEHWAAQDWTPRRAEYWATHEAGRRCKGWKEGEALFQKRCGCIMTN
jgi:hypothetical protein